MRQDPRRWGYILDAYVYDSRKGALGNPIHLVSIVQWMANVAKMQVISISTHNIKEELEKLDKEVFEDEGGWSVHALLSTSHINLHAWPNRGFFMLDMVSCREFDAEILHCNVVEWLAVTNVVQHVVATPGEHPNWLFHAPPTCARFLYDKHSNVSQGYPSQR